MFSKWSSKVLPRGIDIPIIWSKFESVGIKSFRICSVNLPYAIWLSTRPEVKKTYICVLILYTLLYWILNKYFDFVIKNLAVSILIRHTGYGKSIIGLCKYLWYYTEKAVVFISELYKPSGTIINLLSNLEKLSKRIQFWIYLLWWILYTILLITAIWSIERQ